MSLRTKFLIYSFFSLGVIATLVATTVFLGVRDEGSRRQIESDLKESGDLLALETCIESLRRSLDAGGAGPDLVAARAELLRARGFAGALRESVSSDEVLQDEGQKEMVALGEVDAALGDLELLLGGESGREAPGLERAEAAAALQRLHAALGLFREGSFEEVHGAAVRLNEGRRTLLKLQAAGLVAMVVLFATAGVAFSYGVLRPVKRLARMTRRLSRIDFDVEVRHIPEGEIGELTRSFLSMARSLEAFTREIESRVRDRTRELEESRGVLSLMLDNMPDAVALRGGDGSLLACNGAYRALFAASSGGAAPLLSAERTPQGYAVWRSPGGESLLLDVLEFHREAGGAGRDGTRIEYIRDVTRLVRVESALAQSSRLVALGRLAAGIAHEVNSPLTAIGACAEGLLKRSARGDVQQSELREYLEVIHREVYRCKSLTERMLDLSRQRQEPAVPTDVRAVVTESLKLLAYLPRAGAVRLTLVPGDACTAMVQPSALRQILLNLLMNAIGAVEDGGSITVSVTGAGDAVRLEVADDGVGIDPGVLAEIFEPFFTGRRGREGTGLGLFLSRELATAMGGRLEGWSDGPGRGSRFELTLPAATEQHPAAPQEAHAP